MGVARAGLVAILTRAPSSGGKSRLFHALRRPPDPDLLAALLLDTVDAVQSANVSCLIAVEPADRCDDVRALVPDVEVVPQAGGSLGARMSAAMGDALMQGASAVAIIGSDLPDLQPAVITQAFATLETDPAAVVLGPARDGGYYLIAGTSVPPLFDGIEWGTSSVLEQTLAVARDCGVRVHLLPEMEDVDDVEGLVRVRARRTRAWARAHL